MVFSEEVKTDFKSIEKDKFIGNKAILEYFENIAGRHADSLGDGYKDADSTAWVLLDWKVSVVRRPTYGEKLSVSTWSHSIERCYGNRYFELRDERGELCAGAVSKWLLMNTEKWAIARVTPEVAAKYLSEPERSAPIDDPELTKMKEPAEYSRVTPYTVLRRDIDMLGHVHNTYYIDLAYEALPEDVYGERLFSCFRITYKKEIKYGEELLLKYACVDGVHTVAIWSADGSVLHSLMELK